MSVRKAERLINLLVLLLESPRPVTAHEIRETIPGYGQEQWESFKRMFERDKEELREMGIPVERGATDVWELEEGYRVPKERYYLPDLELEDDEVAALWLAAGIVKLQDPWAARSALLKLGADIPPGPDDQLPARVRLDAGLAVPGLEEAFAAVADRKRVTFSYRRRDGVRARAVDPYGLVHRRGSWYLVGHDQKSDAVRSFRLDRVVGEIRQLDPTGPGPEFQVPEGFHPQAALEAPPFVQGEEILARARVRFDASTAWLLEATAPWLHLEWSDDGSAVAETTVTEVSGFISWVLWYGEGADLLSPEDLRVALRARLEDICG